MENIKFVVHEHASEEELNNLVAATERLNTQYRAEIARNDQIKAQAQHRLVGLQLQAAEVE